MPPLRDQLTIGEVATRSGVPHTALRFYEQRGLIFAERTGGNQRRYPRTVLRRLAFIRAAQRVGMSLDRIAEALEKLPPGTSPTKAHWARLSASWKEELETRIDGMQRLRDRLASCIGCGCLSLKSCSLHNADDQLADLGAGASGLQPAAEGGC
ncbi:redox-sensitive transcriptional activator SoxR [Actinoalloteichus hymeniacidonis]|uniref:Redox-sensitive transcriptional activator SoxR n=1 Tax=Actinoalloteichus hymeniacidonis TaxID=340345 RepID=A0AAC9MX13_9PSEU|nr:redox-sensitive transcriptional activator SoxR [Actinoalloteichus hymeniacidonis]AOS62758.1 redox-sensitive transcriptional activator SoxR [Actinoalloteichus hymeniacidonis]MBB5909211.1 MerR family redox-sensitive transcriptional activator SoxR [Actinoalloteichus hymeniacidonis]